jgi:hypothetical protein
MNSTASPGVTRPTLLLVPLGLLLTLATVTFGVIHGPSAIAWLTLLATVVTIGSASIMGRLDIAAATLVVVASFSGFLAVITDSPVSAYPSNIGLGIFVLACLGADMAVGRYKASFRVAGIGVLVLAAAVLAPSQRTGIRYIVCSVLWCGAINVVYMIPEYIHGPLLNPAAAYAFNSQTSVASYNGVLPGNYTFYGSGTSHLRLGGLLFNPPVTGIFLALCGVLAFWTIRQRLFAVALSLIFLVAVLGTYARAGVLLFLIGVSMPWLSARLGRKTSAVLMALVLAVGAPVVASQGGSVKHSEGLFIALTRSLTHPWKVAFGHFGNATHTFDTGGESLLGVFLVGTGGFGIVIAAITIWKYFGLVSATNWAAGVGVAALLVAALTESASSLTGTACLWLIVGAALAVGSEEIVVRRVAPVP